MLRVLLKVFESIHCGGFERLPKSMRLYCTIIGVHWKRLASREVAIKPIRRTRKVLWATAHLPEVRLVRRLLKSVIEIAVRPAVIQNTNSLNLANCEFKCISHCRSAYRSGANLTR